MDKQKFLKKMKSKYSKFEKLHYEIVDLVNEFVSDEKNLRTVQDDELREYEQLCFTYAWIFDRLNNKTGCVGGKNYSTSTTKKIRKALGYLQ